MNASSVSLRRLTDREDDYRLLDRWCSQEAVWRYFEQRILSPEEIRCKYRPRTMENAAVPVWMIEADGTPVGIIQYQSVDAGQKAIYGLPETVVYEMDLFIGEAAFRGAGIGGAAIALMQRRLFEDSHADALVLCPFSDNLPALRCYRKCGYAERKRFIAADTLGAPQEFILMVRTASDAR